MSPEIRDNRQLAEEIFLAGVDAVHPSKLMGRCLKRSEEGLIINGVLHRIKGKIYVAGAGKASGAMAEAAEEILGDMIAEGHVIVKYGYSKPLKKIKITEAGHPLPDHNGYIGTKKIVEIAKKAGEDDMFIFLVSGGGSSLLADYPEGASEQDMMKMNDLLVRCGASISEINIVRKHLSRIKGGQLARLVYPATLVNLIVSDVPGDSPAVIASGPAYPDDSTFAEAMNIVERYNITEKMPESLLRHLKKGVRGEIPENPDASDPVFQRTFNVIVGNNRMALEAAAARAEKEGCDCIIDEDLLCLDVEAAAEYIVKKALSASESGKQGKPLCLVFGGETTVRVKGGGTGGRNQHLALLCARLLRRHPGITVLCGGTDGTDGPTEAAGAVVDSSTWRDAIMNRIDPQWYIENYDSFNFFREAGGLIITGPTFTNVMDLIVVICQK